MAAPAAAPARAAGLSHRSLRGKFQVRSQALEGESSPDPPVPTAPSFPATHIRIYLPLKRGHQSQPFTTAFLTPQDTQKRTEGLQLAQANMALAGPALLPFPLPS